MSKLRIVIITQGISFIVQPLLESSDDIVGIVESAPRNYSKVAKETLFSKVKTCYQLIKGDKSLKNFAKEYEIPYILLDKGNHEQVAELVRKWFPDLIVVYSMSQLLRRSIFCIPALGTINIHPAKLPAYRGPNPILWMYHDMEMNPGVTIHYIDEGEDTGDIIEQGTFPISLGMLAADWQKREQSLALKLLFKAIENLKNGTSISQKQPVESPTIRARNITPEEALHFISWSEWGVERVWHFLRGEGQNYSYITPPLGLYRGQIWHYSSYIKMQEHNKPGTIYKKKGIYFLACKDGCIELSVSFSIKQFLKYCLKA